MTVPCLGETTGVSLSIDPTTGKLIATLNVASSSGLQLQAGGIGINLGLSQASGGGLGITSNGLTVATRVDRAGWDPGDPSDRTLPNTAVGANAYQQIGSPWSINVQRRDPLQQDVVQVQYHAEVVVAVSDPINSNQFWGWNVALERSFNSGPWTELVAQGASGGDNAIRHDLFAMEDLIIGGTAIYPVDIRITVRGSSAGTVIVKETLKRYTRVRYL